MKWPYRLLTAFLKQNRGWHVRERVGPPDRGPPGSLARRSYGPLGRPRPLRIDPRPPRSEPRAPKSDPRPPQDPPGTTQDRPRAAQEPPRRTQDHLKRHQERPKSPKERPGEAKISNIVVFPVVFQCFLKLQFLQPRPLENRC